MSEQSEMPVFKKNPEVVALQDKMQEFALAHLKMTDKIFLDKFQGTLTESGHLIDKVTGEPTSTRPMYLIHDLGVSKELEQKARQALGMSE